MNIKTGITKNADSVPPPLRGRIGGGVVSTRTQNSFYGENPSPRVITSAFAKRLSLLRASLKGRGIPAAPSSTLTLFQLTWKT
jgi:hypothetical protein